MSTSNEEIFKSALSLPEADRIILATELLDSFDDSMPCLSVGDPAFLKELERRANDKSPGIPWEEVKLRVESKLSR
jgi:putative addiction module component (TIGR02574 family)